MLQKPVVSILSGDGKSPETAVRFSKCERSERIRAEREFICSLFGEESVDWARGVHFTTMDMQSNWHIDLPDGGSRSIYFETSTGDDE